ncbi:MBL fold metallo-hydrolase [Chloroflexota bacterium]
MAQVDEVAQGIYRLEAQIPGLSTVFSIFLIKGSGGVLIEPGPAALVPTVQAVMDDLDFPEPAYIIPTHIHLDHAGGAGKLAQLFPNAKVVVHPAGAKHIIDPSRLIQSTSMAFGEDFETVYGAILPVPEAQVRVASDGERLSVSNRELIIIHTPGHAPHHIAIFDTKVRGLFCGEALGLFYNAGSPPLPAVAPPGLDAEVYLQSMERLRQLSPRILFYSHGGIGNEPETLIPAVIENTEVVGAAILRALQMGKSDEAVIRDIGDYIRDHFGMVLEEYDLASNVSGYIHYYRRKGLA